MLTLVHALSMASAMTIAARVCISTNLASAVRTTAISPQLRFVERAS